MSNFAHFAASILWFVVVRLSLKVAQWQYIIVTYQEVLSKTQVCCSRPPLLRTNAVAQRRLKPPLMTWECLNKYAGNNIYVGIFQVISSDKVNHRLKVWGQFNFFDVFERSLFCSSRLHLFEPKKNTTVFSVT